MDTFGIFMFNDQLTTEIIFNLTNIKLSYIHFKWVLCLSILSTFVNSIFLYDKKYFDCNIPVELFLLMVFAVVFYKSTLIWSFAIYFILWHSLPSILDQTKQLYGCISKEMFLNT